MEGYQLTLSMELPTKAPMEQTIPLALSCPQPASIQDFFQECDHGLYVYAEAVCRFTLVSPQPVAKVELYCNGAKEPCSYNPKTGEISLELQGGCQGKPFQDCYGFAQIQVAVGLGDDTTKTLFSPYLPVRICSSSSISQGKEIAEGIVEYVYHHQRFLRLDGTTNPQSLAQLQQEGRQTFEAQMLLAENIATIYQSSYPYFKANSRFRIEKQPTVGQLERLQYIHQQTLSYMVCHPEHLQEIGSEGGISVNMRSYQPRKVLYFENVPTYDTYENRAILGFLRTMMEEISRLYQQCVQLLEQIPTQDSEQGEYDSYLFMCQPTRNHLQQKAQRLLELQDTFSTLWGIYQTAFGFDAQPTTELPQATAVFLSIPQYHRIFECIYQWFCYGAPDTQQERFMLSFVRMSALYEKYLLIKLVEYLETKGYILQEKRPFHYKMPVEEYPWKYQNTDIPNTYHFEKEGQRVTLYYQPVLYHRDFAGETNGIDLRRNHSLLFFDTEEWELQKHAPAVASYYTPDYLLKIEQPQGGASYVVMDAKFSNKNTVKGRYIKDLVFKYLFSLSPKEQGSKVVGLCALYGKADSQERGFSLYDSQKQVGEIRPFVEFLPMREGLEHPWAERLDEVLQSYLCPKALPLESATF